MDKRKRFTLIELLIVVAIIGILASILAPSLSKARHAGKRALCISNLKQLGLMTMSYTDDNAEYFFLEDGTGNHLNPSNGLSYDELLIPYDGRDMSAINLNSDYPDYSQKGTDLMYKCIDHTRKKPIRSYQVSSYLAANAHTTQTAYYKDVIPTQIGEIARPTENIMFMETWRWNSNPPNENLIGAILGRRGANANPGNGASMKARWLDPTYYHGDMPTYHARPLFTTNFTFSDGHVGEMHINKTYIPSNGTPAIDNGGQDWKASVQMSDMSMWDYKYE